MAGQPVGQPADQQRVAAGGVVARPHEGVGHRTAIALGEHRAGRGRRQRREPDRRDQGRTERAARPRRREQQHGQGVEPVREELQEPRRRAVGPVQVVDDKQLRALLRQRRHQPVQPVKNPERRLRVGRGVREHDGPGERGGAGERAAACAGRHPPQTRLEQLAHDAPGVRLLQLGPARDGRGKAALARRLAHPLEHARLPDAHGALQNYRRPSPARRRVERVADNRELVFALVEPDEHVRSGVYGRLADSPKAIQSRAWRLRDRSPAPGRGSRDSASGGTATSRAARSRFPRMDMSSAGVCRRAASARRRREGASGVDLNTVRRWHRDEVWAMHEAEIETTLEGQVPVGAGWFVLNLGEMAW